MSANIGGVIVICEEDDNECELCGAFEETRPYGPNGERICWVCGQKDLETTNRVMRRVLFGDTEPN